MGGDNYRKEHKRQCVNCPEVEAETACEWRPLEHRLSDRQECTKGPELAQTLHKRNWVLNRKLSICGVVDQEC